MTPEVRAIADRFILDTANVKYVATTLPKGGLERPAPGLDWTVRQLIGHVSTSLERHLEFTRAFLADGEVPSSLEPGEFNRAAAAANRKVRLPALLGRLDNALRGMVDCLESMASEDAERAFAERRLADVLDSWSRHPIAHGMDLVDAIEESRSDPMVLNWILYADFRDDPKRLERQQELLAEVRERYREGGDDWDDEGGWEEGDDDAL